MRSKSTSSAYSLWRYQRSCMFDQTHWGNGGVFFYALRKVKCHFQLDILEDNKAATAINRSPASQSRIMHIEPKLCWVRDIVSEGIIKLTYIRSLDQLADSFTKVCIGKELFLAHRAKYMVEWRSYGVLLVSSSWKNTLKSYTPQLVLRVVFKRLF